MSDDRKLGFVDMAMLRRREMNRFIPAKGFNVVAVDTFESDPDCELSLVGHYDTREEADAAAAKHMKTYPTDRAYVYAPDKRGGDLP